MSEPRLSPNGNRLVALWESRPEINADWASMRAWLFSLGMTNHAIHVWRLDRYQYMTRLAWDCLVKEALRSRSDMVRDKRSKEDIQWLLKHHRL